MESDVPLERFNEALHSRLAGPFRRRQPSGPASAVRPLVRPKEFSRKFAAGRRHAARQSATMGREDRP